MATKATLAQLVTNAKADDFFWLYTFLQSHAVIDTMDLLSEKEKVTAREDHKRTRAMRELAEDRLLGYQIAQIAETLNSSGIPVGNTDLTTTCDKMECLWKKARGDEDTSWSCPLFHMVETDCEEITRGMKECISQLKNLSERLKPTVMMP